MATAPAAWQATDSFLAAQQRLLTLRKQLGVAQKTSSDSKLAESAGVNSDSRRCPDSLPSHLGWHSTAVTRTIRGRLPKLSTPTSGKPLNPGRTTTLPPPPCHHSDNDHVAVFPDLAMAILRRRLAAVARVWFLLRHLDHKGSGWFTLANVREHLTSTDAPQRICGWRQLRNLLAAGDGVFWERDENRLWLRSQSRLACALGINRCQFRPVFVPVATLCGGIASVRSQLYATFHSLASAGKSDSRSGNAPISRAALSTLCERSRQTLRRYETLANIRRRFNYAIGEPYSANSHERRAGKHGHATFVFKDSRGLQGMAGRIYVAWQLPNSYIGPHSSSQTGQRRRLNRLLADLSDKGTTGNGDNKGDWDCNCDWRYLLNARDLTVSARLDGSSDCYLPQSGIAGLWSVFTGRARK